MKDCTYYDLLGVSEDASIEQIVAAKNFLVKKFHPDANISSTYDTTSYMQKVLDAYHILSIPKTRRAYDRHLTILREKRKMSNPHTQNQNTDYVSPNFAPYWEAANKINELVSQCSPMIKNKLIRKTESEKDDLQDTAEQLKPYIKILEDAEIPKEYWHSHAINWILFQWSQNRDLPYPLLFSMYQSYLEQHKNSFERRKILAHSTTFLSNLDLIMAYALS